MLITSKMLYRVGASKQQIASFEKYEKRVAEALNVYRTGMTADNADDDRHCPYQDRAERKKRATALLESWQEENAAAFADL